ncbi:MAG: methyltransferase domain-containing protein [Ignavibacteriaceae bacterium]|nr:methyltransferase domain-containing protein [Ignavibacteriaceae bacterium]NUM71312.1 methyltransferase domain-containing protein [Ignavibacteriaceae bacterium]
MPYSDINSPEFNDNRSYDYTRYETEDRLEYSVIEKMIPENSKVIDLGCGNGSLLDRLKYKKKCTVTGVEISESGVEVCHKKGITCFQKSIDVELPFENDSFDYSVCNVTIQMVMYPEVLLEEMKRISQNIIISFPNFAFYKNRIDLLTKGRMPRYCLFGYNWYNTGHIHQLSIRDFSELVTKVGGLKTAEIQTVPSNGALKNFLTYKIPDLFMLLPVIRLQKL